MGEVGDRNPRIQENPGDGIWETLVVRKPKESGQPRRQETPGGRIVGNPGPGDIKSRRPESGKPQETETREGRSP